MKQKIRKEILEKRSELAWKDWEEKSLIIQEKFLSIPFYKNSKVIFTYYHFDREVKTDFIIEKSLQDKKIVCLPKNDWEKREMIPVQILSFNEIDTDRRIPEPKGSKYIEKNKIDIIVVPGVVFDIYGNRIGMGGGFYDKFIADIGKEVFKISLAFEFQILEKKLPVSEWDRKVDMIITEERILTF